MSIIDDCVQFLEDLIVGDFNEQQMVSAQIMGGLLSLIPVIDQVMDVRDVSGNLYRINKRGGFAKATLDQKIDFGFAAFGVVPEVGSAFKTVFKPLYKQRKAAKGVINGGVAMIEGMLGHKKGGAVRWVKALDWAGNTQAAIIQANLALDSCIAMLTYLGQSHWWCPDHLEQLARDVTPGLKSMRGKLEAPIREAAGEIRKFLEEMLGEHAAAVALAVTNAAIVGHPSSSNKVIRPQAHKTIGGKSRVQAKAARGKIASKVQRTAWESYQVLTRATKGLLGEHVVEHYVIEKKNWGLQWNQHDMIAVASNGKIGGWQNEYKKINDNGLPKYLCNPSGEVLRGGIDSLWFTDRNRPHQYAVVEAKASMSPTASLYQLLADAENKPVVTAGSGRNRTAKNRPSARQEKPGKEINANTPTRVMQMSDDWIRQRIDKKFPAHKARILGNYSRHVFLVTPLQLSEHLAALEKIVEDGFIGNPKAAQKYAHLHKEHHVHKEFGEEALEEAELKYRAEGPYRWRSNGKNK